MFQIRTYLYKYSIVLIAILLFSYVLSLGFLAARHKVLWLDENYTHNHTIQNQSFSEILKGKSRGEPNSCPLFYIIQKTICKAFDYTFPFSWKGQYYVSHQRSQIILRIASVLSISLAFVLIFYFFSKRYSIWFGIYSAFLLFSSRMVWQYIAEARPYALWLFLTTLQTLILFHITTKKDESKFSISMLSVANILLSLAFIVGLGQVAISTFIYWVFVDKKRTLSLFYNHRLKGLLLCMPRYIGISIAPFFISLFYYLRASHFGARFTGSIFYLIKTCVPIEQLIVIVAVTLLCMVFFIVKRFNNNLKKFNCSNPISLSVILYFLMTFALILVISLSSKADKQLAPITVRHFIYLTPVSVIAMTVFFKNLLEFFKDNLWMKTNIIIIFITIALMSFLKYCLPVLRTF